jgi:hypothetical protein
VNTIINMIPFFIDVTSSSLVDGNQYFGGNCCSHIRGSLHHGVNHIIIIIIIIIISGVRLIPLGTAATVGLLYQPQMIDDDDCGAIGGMKIDRGNRSTRRKSAPAPLCPPQIPHVLTRARSRAAAVGSRRLPAWAMARSPWGLLLLTLRVDGDCCEDLSRQ